MLFSLFDVNWKISYNTVGIEWESETHRGRGFTIKEDCSKWNFGDGSFIHQFDAFWATALPLDVPRTAGGQQLYHYRFTLTLQARLLPVDTGPFWLQPRTQALNFFFFSPNTIGPKMWL